MFSLGISPGAEVKVILANSTIPMISEVYKEGNRNFSWPLCDCGYQTSEKDIFGALLKCGNSCCTERSKAIKAHLEKVGSWADVDLNKVFLIDRFDWNKKTQVQQVLGDIKGLVSVPETCNVESLYAYLEQYFTTDLQKRNLSLLVGPGLSEIKTYFGI